LVTGDSPKGFVCSSAPRGITPLSSRRLIKKQQIDTAQRDRAQDGREISAPLAWFPRLRDATPEQRRHWRLIGTGVGVHWPDIDEDIAVATLMRNS